MVEVAAAALAHRDGIGRAARLEALTLLGHGRPAAARAIVADHGDADPFAALVVLDAGVRTLAAGAPDINRARLLIDEAPRDERHQWWLRAIVAERKLIEGDFAGVATAASVLDRLPSGPLDDVLTVYLRGRLARAAGLAALGDAPIPPSRGAAALGDQALRAAAVDDLRHCGFLAEVAMTRALWSVLRALLRYDEPPENLLRALDARADLVVAAEPAFSGPLDFVIGLLGLLVGDAERVYWAARQTAAALTDDSPLRPVPGILRALAGLLAGEPVDPLVRALDDGIDGLRGVNPRLVPALQIQAAQVLAGRGHPAATRFGLAALDTPPANPVEEVDGALLGCRMAAAAGTVPDPGHVFDLLDRLEHLGHRRLAAAKARQLAQDVRRLGEPGLGGELQDWARERVRVPSDDVFGDQGVNGGPGPEAAAAPGPPATAVRPAPMAAATLVVRVLRPVLAVERAGRPVAVRPSVAKLLVALLGAHPTPVHVEQAMDLLWPGLDPRQARGRLSTVLHRLRRLVGPAADIRRVGDVLVLEPVSLVVDICRVRTALAGGDDAGAAAALAGVGANLCAVQFPYDDLLIDQRRALAARWRAASPTLVARRVIDAALVERVGEALDPAPPSPG
jgi:hypothetical protein